MLRQFIYTCILALYASVDAALHRVSGFQSPTSQVTTDQTTIMLPDELLTDELLSSINDSFPCRVPQLQRLSALIGDV